MAHRPHLAAPRRVRTVAVSVTAALVLGLLAAVAPVTPVAAVTVTQANVSPGSCTLLHDGSIQTCRGIDITSRILVNGADAGTTPALRVGDVLAVSVTVAPRGGHDAMYQETVDGLRNNADVVADIAVGLPTVSTAVLSAPTAVRMSRTDSGDRGNGPAINCLAQNGQDAARTDADRAITLGASPVGLNGMRAAVAGGTLTGSWTTMSFDRCTNVVSNNGAYAGHTLSFTQTVTGRTTSPLRYQLGTISLRRTDNGRTVTWGSASTPTFTGPAPTVPTAPRNVVLSGLDGTLDLTWDAPADDGGLPLAGYTVRVQRNLADTGISQTLGVVGSTSITGLANGFTYTVTVAARNAAGTGPAGLSDTVTLIGKPGTPATPFALGGDGQATLSWSAPTTGGSPITGYSITPYVGGLAQASRTVPATPTADVILGGLTNGTSYRFTVRAVNAFGPGGVSPVSNAVTPAKGITAPEAPGIGSVAVGNRRTSATWTAPNDGGSPITAYDVDVLRDGTIVRSTTGGPTFLSYLDDRADNGHAYSLVVRARNSAGTGPAVTIPIGTPLAFRPFLDLGSFIRRQFLDLAGREPTTSELATWTAALTDGSKEGTDLVLELAQAPYWDGTLAPIVRLYRAIYLRDPDLGGLQYWEGEVRSGRRSINQMANFVARNAEFVRLYGNLDDTAFISKVYELVLDRAPDATGLAYWKAELARGVPRGRMVLLFSGSPEYKATSADRVLATLLSYGLLRTVAKTTIDALTVRIAQDDAEGAVLALLNDPAYAARFGQG